MNMHIRLINAILVLSLIAGSSLLHAGGKNETAITNWLVIINNPGACAGNAEGFPCTEADIFGPAFTEPPPANTNPTMATVCFGTGSSVQANGRGTFVSRFAEGSNYGCFFPDGSAMGLIDASSAEVHMVLQEHGYSKKSGAGLEEQVAQFEGGCNPDCTDSQFTIHLPAAADGEGVSTTSLYWFADGSMIGGTSSTLMRHDDGIQLVVHTRLNDD